MDREVSPVYADPLTLTRDWLRFVAHAADRREPGWATPHRIVMRRPVAWLRDFSARGAGGAPVLVLPPQAGHSSCIVDFQPEQSQMRTVLAAGHTRTLSLDWRPATAATADAGVEDFLAAVDAAVEVAGEPVHLIGDCQGGWLATIYAAQHPERVRTLTIAGAPVDFHAGEPLIHGWVEALAPGGDTSVYRALVALGGGLMRGELLLAGFIALRPADEIRKQLDLLASLDDPAHVRRYVEFERWYKHTQDLPGAFYLWIVERLFRDNALVRGELDVGGRRVDLADIACPLFMLAGAEDHITPPAQVFALGRHVATPAAERFTRLASGGHLGLFMGHRSLREHWPPLLEALREH